MASVVRMPSVLAGASEAAIASWLVIPGATVTVGTPIAEIETEKAVVEYAVEQDGIIGRLVIAAGDSANVADPIAVLIAPGETDADIDAALGTTAQAERGADPPPALPATPGPARRVFISPLVRKLARERGLDLAGLSGTGPGGRIVRRDLQRFLAASPPGMTPNREPQVPPAAAPASSHQPSGAAAAAPASALIPHTPMRRAIARRLTESKATVPHFYLKTECVADELLALRERVNQTSAVRVSVNDFVITAIAAAFADVPEANVTWTDDGLRTHSSVDLSIAVATEGGLVTPVLRGVENRRLTAIARESAALAQRARARTLRQHELEGGSFAVSNLGMYGTAEFSAIINPPQSGILAVGAARSQAVVADGQVVPATVIRCTLSVDHRAIDGALAARWLAAFTGHLEHPLGLLI